VLQVKPLSDFGSTVEIVFGIFGSRDKYLQAIALLEVELCKSIGKIIQNSTIEYKSLKKN